MITFCKKSKLDKVNTNFFTIIKVSMEREDENETSLPYIIPPASIIIPFKQGNLSKKKFLKKYKKYLSESKGVEFAIFNILKAIKNKRSLCFTCTDDEYDYGYLKVLCEYISDEFGLEILPLKEARYILNSELETLDKKNRKLIKKSEDEIESPKKKKNRDKIIKNINRLIKSEFSEDGYDKFNILDKKFAVEQIMWSSIDNGICSFNNNKISDVDESKINKTRPYITAIELTYDNDKEYRSIIKSVLEENSLKMKPKQLKKLSKTQIVFLCGEIIKRINEYRENE